MAITGTLAIVGFVLLVAQLVFGGALNSLTHDGPLTGVPLVLGLMCLALAFVWGLAKGPAALRFAVLCGLGSLFLFGYAIVEIYPIYFDRSVYLAGSAALFVLAITLGVLAFTNARATSHEPVRE